MIIKSFTQRHTSFIQKIIPPLTLLILLIFILTACGPSHEIGYQARLTDGLGNPINGDKSVTFRLWTVETGTDAGNKIFEETQSVTVSNGLLSVDVGKISTDAYGRDGIDPSIFARPLWLEIVVDGETLSPRQKLLGAPYAMSLPGGAVVGGLHEGNGAGGNDTTDINYGSLSVVGGNGGTALMLGVVGGATPGDIIRGCSGVPSARACNDLEFQVTGSGQVYADGTFHTPAADFAEMVRTETDSSGFEAGDVLVISEKVDRAVALSMKAYAGGVIGVYSTRPGFVGGKAAEVNEKGRIPVAIVGIVPVKVSAENGPIQRGDLLTTASMPGYAMRASEYVPGAILGKAMGELQAGAGVIEVLLMLR